MIQTIKIFPPIGVARLGNSRDAYFIGPEKPGDHVAPPGGYRDGEGAIKRQAARFHLFAFDETGALIGELTPGDIDTLEWTVHVANTKAAAEMFHGKDVAPPGLRNRSFADRGQLKLDPGAVIVAGVNPDFGDLARSRTTGAAKELIIDQAFLNVPIHLSLGTVTTDSQGLLLVLGGYGESKSPTGADLTETPDLEDFANHDEWYDDVSDGRVSARVKLSDGTQPPVLDAWVIVAPPKYAPGLETVVTLYDTLFQKAVDAGLIPDPFANPAFQPSMATDILPILTRAANMRWVYDNGQPQMGSFTFHHTLNSLPPANRMAVFNRLGVPPATRGNTSAGGGNMPKNWSDQYPGGANGTLTETQYKAMAKWRDGQTVPGVAPTAADPITPDGLTRAALDTCVGAPFFPGIDASWKMREVFDYREPFRLNSGSIDPGDISSQMSLPWQSDFLDCAVEPGPGGNLVWWPAQRPVKVFRHGGTTYIPWSRVTDADPTSLTVAQMVTEWVKLAFVTQQANGRYEEEPRA
jgi:hypothetical protein